MKRTGTTGDVPVDEELLGGAVDALGNATDGKGSSWFPDPWGSWPERPWDHSLNLCVQTNVDWHEGCRELVANWLWSV